MPRVWGFRAWGLMDGLRVGSLGFVWGGRL